MGNNEWEDLRETAIKGLQEGDNLILNSGISVTYLSEFEEGRYWVSEDTDSGTHKYVIANTMIASVHKAYKNAQVYVAPKCDCGKDKSNSLGPHSDYCTLVEKGLV